MSSVRFANIGKSFGATRVLSQVDFEVREGEFVTLLGASGSGKTTCLRIVAGFVQPDEGRIYIGDQDVTRVEPNHRDIGLVFQQYALFPHLSVAQNVAFGLRVRRLDRAEIDKRVRRALQTVRLEGLENRHPNQLSGGQRQRVALARAIVIDPRVLLLDEPLSALDLQLRQELQGELHRIQRELGITTIFVTHDQNEALMLSDRVAVMHQGRISQLDTATELYEKPATLEVARFIGRMNFLSVQVQGRAADGWRVRAGHHGDRAANLDAGRDAWHVPSRQVDGIEPGASALLAVRPEHLRLGDEFSENDLPAVVESRQFLGDGWLVHCRDRHAQAITVRLAQEAAIPRAGDAVRIGWASARAHLYRAPQEAAAPAPQHLKETHV